MTNSSIDNFSQLQRKQTRDRVLFAIVNGCVMFAVVLLSCRKPNDLERIARLERQIASMKRKLVTRGIEVIDRNGDVRFHLKVDNGFDFNGNPNSGAFCELALKSGDQVFAAAVHEDPDNGLPYAFVSDARGFPAAQITGNGVITGSQLQVQDETRITRILADSKNRPDPAILFRDRHGQIQLEISSKTMK